MLLIVLSPRNIGIAGFFLQFLIWIWYQVNASPIRKFWRISFSDFFLFLKVLLHFLIFGIILKDEHSFSVSFKQNLFMQLLGQWKSFAGFFLFCFTVFIFIEVCYKGSGIEDTFAFSNSRIFTQFQFCFMFQIKIIQLI